MFAKSQRVGADSLAIWTSVALFMLLCVGLVSSPLATAASTSTAGTARRAVAAASLAADAATITFDDHYGESISNQYQEQGVVFENAPEVTDDDANPTSPVLSGPSGFGSSIEGRFVDPVTGADSTVATFTLDVGYINNRDSTVVDAFDRNGALVLRVVAQDLGINRLTLTYAGMASFTVSSVADEVAGFGIDNFVVGSASAPRPITSMAALGDSYSSGEGMLQGQGLAYDCGTDMGKDTYFKDTTVPRYWGPAWPAGSCDTRTLSGRRPAGLASRAPTLYENRCHRHGQAYPVGIARAIGVDQLLFVACSGATTASIGEIPRTALPQYPHSPVNVAGGHTQLMDLANFRTRLGRDPDLITIGVGGNDAGFVSIIWRCLITNCSHDAKFVGALRDRISTKVYDALAATFSGLRNDFPDSTVVAFGYVDPVSPNAGENAGDCHQAPFGADDVRFAADVLFAQLNQAVADAARAEGVAFVDPSPVTAGHELCSADSWFRGPSFPSQQSFHPTQTAHQHISDWFAAHYLDANGRLLLHDGPRATGTLRPPASGSPGTIAPVAVNTPVGGCLQGCTIQIEGSGYSPGTVGRIVLYSDPVDLGAFTADPDGRVKMSVRIPTKVPVGPHVITLDGFDPHGAPQWGANGFDVRARAARVGLVISRRKSRVKMVLRCPAGASSACRVVVALRREWRARGHRRRSILGRRTVSVARGGHKTIVFTSAAARRHPREISVVATTTTTAGKVTRTTRLRR